MRAILRAVIFLVASPGLMVRDFCRASLLADALDELQEKRARRAAAMRARRVAFDEYGIRRV